ncbi:FtsK/SpoIIIE family protein [Rhodococcus rhodochrous J3]|uniref:FtsK/SpoIIIE family protein n=1 Tax=Rhodococcus rhodochrous J3 TaxID=903528 RepID=A0ABY1MIK1_RHORH|nr:FtsK/SpoIIIE domain-containing protein [Rhodococcus rhodochrous]MBF4476710.1 AAA family ATPase [Rhodococcus rhodochrous]MCD2099998.1 AAA family ATPase [Rhodococcus rhodochrous]MCD2124396.1 AAA family ATPase [Rhodococcus rhodochrous]MCQ4137907.1 FtsK/SpoIIIE domain-containing protein [Rhodococcus rhodochrous]MDJ0021066.1 FtsK/SpoIIIE domain-containing protein [Rhodococcus rhodochrous]
MSGTPDPLKDWLVAAWRDTFGDTTTARGGRVGDDGRTSRVPRFVPVSPFAAVPAAAAFTSSHLIASAAGNQTPIDVLTQLHDHRWPLTVVTAPLIGLDISRHRARRWSQMLESMVQQSTGHTPTKISVPLPMSGRTMRRATITLPRGAVIRPKQFEQFSRAVESAFDTELWAMTVRHDAHRDRLVLARTAIAPDTRSERQKVLQDALDAASIFKSPKVSVDTIDDSGIETGYRIAFAKSMNAGAPAFQAKVDEALASLAGPHESGRHWTCDWYPNKGYLVMRLVTAMPDRVDHPLELVDENLRHLPYATGAADRIMFWDVSTSSNKPHCLIVGPTGGGKTSVIRTLLTEAARRGIPFVGVDPKMIELDGLEGYPGCGAIIYDALRAAMFVRALHTEMMARNAYIHQMKIEGSQLPLMIAVLDEFFILSGKWQRLAKTGDDETKAQLKELDPLGAWADLAVLARSAGIRLLLGVQRPDASLFGGASGNARDNFGTRISLGNLSQDGALMMWGDSTVGREVDTSVKGRGIALGDDGNPVDAQMWWTPNVDKHPNKWNQLSESEKAIIDGLVPAEAPQFTCYSPELAEFIESERALAKRARSHGSVPEPIVIGAGRGDDAAVSMVKEERESAPEREADDDFADAIPASSVTAGQTVLVDDSGGELVPVTVDDVEVRRNKKGEVISTVLIVGTGRVKTRITFDATGVVALPDPDSVGAHA